MTSLKVSTSAIAMLCVATLMIPCETIATKSAHLLIALLWMIALLLWAVELFRSGATLRFSWTDAAVLSFVAMLTVSTLVMLKSGNARASLNVWWQWLSFAVTFWLVRQCLHSEKQMRVLCAVLIGAAVAISAFGIYQRYVSLPSAFAAYQRDPERVLTQHNIPTDKTSPLRVQFENRLRTFEPTGTFVHPNSLAGFLAPWLVVAGACTLGNFGHSKTRVSQRVIGIFSVSMIATCLWLTHSRSALVALVVGCTYWLGEVVWSKFEKRRAWTFAIGCAGLVITGLVVAGMNSIGIQESLRFRLEYWQASLAMTMEHICFGCGVGNFQSCYASYKLPQSSELVADPHNLLVEIAATSGVVTCFAFVGVMATSLLRMNGSTLQARKHPSQGPPTPVTRARNHNSARAHTQTTPRDWSAKALSGTLLSGVVIGMISGFLVAQMVHPVFLLVGVPFGVVALIGQKNWIENGHLTRSMIWVVFLVWFTNLVASGGVSYAGVGQTMWILVAMTVNLREKDREIRCSRVTAGVCSSLAAVLTGLCWFTLFAPVTKARPQISAGLLQAANGNLRQARDNLLAAAATDPWSPDPLVHLVNINFQAWEQDCNTEHWDAFVSAARELIRRDPRSHDMRRWLGDQYFKAYRLKDHRSDLQEAIRLYREAVTLYPNQAMLHAQLSWALSVARDDDNAAAEAAKSLALDALTPHREQKLAVQHLWDFNVARKERSAGMIDVTRFSAEECMLHFRNKRKSIPERASSESRWPNLFGPTHDSQLAGKAPHLIWSANGPPVLWRRELEGGYSSPVVWDKRIIVFYRKGNDEMIESLEVDSGKSQWTHRYPTRFVCRAAYSDGPYSTPVTDGEHVYAIGAEAQFHCLSLADGSLTWRRDLSKEFDTVAKLFPFGSSPLLEQDLLIVNLGGRKAGIIAFDKRTGAERWSVTQDDVGYATPVAATIHGQRHVFVLTGNAIVSLDPATGSVDWRIPFQSRDPDVITATTPVVSGDLVFVSGYQLGAMCVRVQPDRGHQVMWQDRRSLDSQHNNLICRDGFVYGFSARKHALTCVSLRTGEEQWTWKSELDRASIMVVGNSFLLLGETGILAVVKVHNSGCHCESMSTPRLASPCYSAPAISSERLFVRNEREIVCFDLRPGSTTAHSYSSSENTMAY